MNVTQIRKRNLIGTFRSLLLGNDSFQSSYKSLLRLQIQRFAMPTSYNKLTCIQDINKFAFLVIKQLYVQKKMWSPRQQTTVNQLCDKTASISY